MRVTKTFHPADLRREEPPLQRTMIATLDLAEPGIKAVFENPAGSETLYFDATFDDDGKPRVFLKRAANGGTPEEKFDDMDCASQVLLEPLLFEHGGQHLNEAAQIAL